MRDLHKMAIRSQFDQVIASINQLGGAAILSQPEVAAGIDAFYRVLESPRLQLNIGRSLARALHGQFG